ncbi:putative MFS family arabinose efflux permease [Silicimonas algicola]|uniref:Putative MFS family arabinose efflux permease n=2 Tax=Silicimonas algicola TaxID=1826607 RepID=A0A316GCU6_9RHOB|nr:putative MFS family arabinose efflux permease [Silicimonas algicola]
MAGEGRKRLAMRALSLDQTRTRPLRQGPVALLVLMAVAMPLAFSTWSALLNNFVFERAAFTGVEIGWLHTVREIPGFLAIAIIPILVVMREQSIALLSLVTLGLATAVTAWFPTFGGLLAVTLVSSVGFHFFEAVYQSLQLQWLPRDRAPQVLGWLVAVGSAASLVSYGLLVATWDVFDLGYDTVYLVSGGACVAIAIYCLAAFPHFEAEEQTKRLVLRRRYWLYYALQFITGARRQIFVVFAAFMMVEHFGFEVHQLSALFLVNYIANMGLAPLMGRGLARWGERNVLAFEYAGLVFVFLAYAGVYVFGWPAWVAATLYVLDHLFFSLAFAKRTYFQKIATPSDIAPTAAVSFTINHIAAVVLPVSLGYAWIVSPSAVFLFAALLALVSLLLALLIPRHPVPGHETIFSGLRASSVE